MRKEFLLAAFISSVCYADHIYPDNAHQRRDPTPIELQRMIRLGGCSASALSPTKILTAHHCVDLYREGQFEADPSKKFKVIKVLEFSHYHALDTAILEIAWEGGAAPENLRYPRKIVTEENELIFGEDKIGTILYSLGFPIDRNKRSTHSWGYLRDKKIYPASEKLKTPETVYLLSNLPSINGNSGSPVYMDDFTLVGVACASQAFVTEAEKKLPSFNSQNPSLWNAISPLYYQFSQSKILPKLFPNGISPKVNTEGIWIEEDFQIKKVK